MARKTRSDCRVGTFEKKTGLPPGKGQRQYRYAEHLLVVRPSLFGALTAPPGRVILRRRRLDFLFFAWRFHPDMQQNVL